MVTWLVRLELAGLFFVVMRENTVGDRLSDIEFIETGVWLRVRNHGLLFGRLKLVETMIYLLDRREHGG